ncbi:MAG TPA: heparan-alpha-glucosaminide N-acetyltransferase domain-containing protein, partial [Ignavibacteriaceae bacterium]
MKKDQTRFIFIDLLRGWALIIMIEVHIFNAFILPPLKETNWFEVLNFVNGLVAPAFLFVSGFAFVISSERKIDELRKYRIYFWNKLIRIGLIFLAGYSLHLPYFSLSKTINESSSGQIMAWLNVDILQCIAAGLLLLLFLRIFIKKEDVFYGLLIAIVVLISIVSPIIWNTDFGNILPLLFADYFNRMYGSFFPLFPWLFFLFTGAVFSKFYIKSRNENREKIFIKKLFLLSLILILLGHLFFSHLFNTPIFSIRPNPLFLYQRLGYVLVLASFFWYYANKRNTGKSFVLDISRESLLTYWLHLEVIYSKVWNGKSLEEIVNNEFSTMECVAATLLLIAGMVIVAKLWGGFKKKYSGYARPVTAG